MASPPAPSTDPTITELRDPNIPSEPEGGVSLSPKGLEDELHRHVEADDKFRPLLALLMAVKNPRENFDDEIMTAIRQIKQDVGEDVPKKMPSDPIFETSRQVFESDGKGALFTRGWQFKNWGRTVQNTPSTTWQIRTRVGVQNLVRWAANNNKRVRVAGFRHTWSNVFGAEQDVIIMLQPYKTLVDLPYKASKNWNSDLQGVTGPIKSVGNGRTPPPGHAFFKVGAGTINDDFRKWCLDNKKYFIPFNVIMVEVTFGGTNAPVCHGAGFSTTTLSDIVVEVEYVDAKGEIRVVNDPEELKTASGCFGLLGVVISITLQLDDMNIAELTPVKKNMVLTIPPPEGYPIPKEVQEIIEHNKITDADIADARTAFIKRCEEDYYLEWFWFPYQNDCWINTWKKRPVTSSDVSIQTYPQYGGLSGVKAQALQGTLAETLTGWKWWYMVSGRNQAWWFGLASMAALPNVKGTDNPIQVYTSDALHFRRGIQNFRVWDIEWEIPVPNKGGQRDYSLIQRAWWDAITAIYADPDAPVRVALEMRLTGGSNVWLAPQRGNTSTASIEVLTTLTTPPEVWKGFEQTITDKWASYQDEEGNYLNVRPHWAKSWEGLSVRGKDIKKYLKEDAYKDAFPAFRQTFERIVTSRGGTVEETRARFGNALMNDLIFDVPEPPAVSSASPNSASGAGAGGSSPTSPRCLCLPSWLCGLSPRKR